MIEILVSLSLVVGTAFIAVSALGLHRMRDVYGRLHAVTKATTLGMAGILLGSALFFAADGALILAEIVTLAFIVMTNPAGAHMIGRSAYLNGIALCDDSVMDEMERAGHARDVTHDTH